MTDETTTTAAAEESSEPQTDPADPAAPESEVPTVKEAPVADVADTPTSEAPEGEPSEGESGFTDPSSKSVDEETGVEDTAGVEEEEEGDEDEESVFGEDEEPKKPRKKKKRKVTKSVDESEDAEDKKDQRPGQPKGVLEYDLADMYPQVGVLVGKPRREWNFHDPEVIRALWLDSRTNAVTDWKVRFGNLRKARQTQVEIPLNHAAQLRLEFHKQKEEKRKLDFDKVEDMMTSSRKTPHFNTVQMATTTTVEMRYKFTRNNPPVPSYYINHYDKYKKPPFKTKVGRPCKHDVS